MKKIFLPILCLIIILLIGCYKSLPIERIRIIVHYRFGNGSDLQLESDYIPKSPVVINALKQMKDVEKKISFKQEKDWRLSYAINGFNLT